MPRGDHTDYSKGYVYMLKNTTTGLIYIGASCDDLNRRLSRHRHHGYINRGCTSIHLFENEGEVTIEVLDYCPCETKPELDEQESYYIRLFKEGCGKQCVNKNIPGRSQVQRYQDNWKAIRERQHDYNVRTREAQQAYKAQWYQSNRDTIVKRGKEYREANKEHIRTQQKAWRAVQPMIRCPCGGHYTKDRNSRHLKTKLHQAYIQATP